MSDCPRISIQQMKDEMLRDFGPPEAGIRRGGMARILTILGWSDLYAEEAL